MAGYGSTKNGFDSAGTRIKGGSTVSFHGIDYVVQVKEDKKKVDKKILHDLR